MYRTQPNDGYIRLLLYSMYGILGIISLRLFYLQVIVSDHYISRGEKNFLRIENTQSQRGNILDRNGNLLATNIPVTHIYWQGTGNRSLSGNQIEKLRIIESIIGQPICSNRTLMAQLSSSEKHYKKIKISSDIPFEQLSKIEERYPDDANINIATHFKRYYPLGSCASHILGYLGKLDMQFHGKMGLEKLCEDVLRGQDGTILKTINSVGRDIAMITLKEASNGAPIHTTLDLGLQNICERVFPHEYAGAFVVMDPADGSILASVSSPSFDPALFLSPISPDVWKSLQAKQPFLNRTLNSYPPGSIFKLISVSALMERGTLHPDDNWYCNGYVTFAQRNYWCNNRWGHGHLNTTQAVAQSCNTPFFELAKKIDIDLLHSYAMRFGLGCPTGFIFNERTGIVPSRAWKMQTIGEPWWPGETLSVSIGQSFLLATPLQIARMIGSIFTGYLVKPRILAKEEIEKIPLMIKPETIQFLKESMKFVVSSGTGKRIRTVKDIEIYAKTSTAQVSDIQKRMLGNEYLEHAWFVAHFQYQDLAPLIFVILVENAGSSQVATSVAKNFLIAYKEIVNQTHEKRDL